MLPAIAALGLLRFQDATFQSVVRPPVVGHNDFYFPTRAPLQNTPLVKLPITAFTPGGWLKKCLELQRDGLTGHLGEISIWLTKKNNAWLNPDGKGDYGWEELPYWLRGYSRIAYALHDPKMLAETKFWVEGTLNSQRQNGDFGPVHNHSRGFRDLWAQMLMLQVLQSNYEFTNDPRILPFMSRYFKWQSAIPDAQFLKDYWENSRGGDNLSSVYWLYNHTGEPFLLELASKIDRNTANWRMLGDLPNYHNVNVAQSFREPAEYYLQSNKPQDLEASYRDFDFIREHFGQVPGGMFGADETARAGHNDPHQAIETCGMVEQIGSNDQFIAITGDPKWAANTEDVAFNTMPAAFTADYRALRYLTAPNMAVSDAANHAPGLDNGGPFLLMNPFSSRCCQHNSSSAWVNYLEGSWMATQDNGLACLLFTEGSITAKLGTGNTVTLQTSTHYPFDEDIDIKVKASEPATGPIYLLIPAWAKGATASLGHETARAEAGRYLKIVHEWRQGDTIHLHLPMHPEIHVWDQMKNSVSVDYGPLTLSLRIPEVYRKVDGTKTAMSDSGWQPGVDQSAWPTFEILPNGPWNFGLPQRPKFKVIHRAWPKNDDPFTLETVPLEIETEGKQIPGWTLDQNGLVAILPKSPVKVAGPRTKLTLVPMGAARLRISAFPNVQ
jgi:hypothetical protein